MNFLTHRGKIVCAHELGVVTLVHRQDFVRVSGSPVLVENDPEGRSISGCPNVGPTIKPCMSTFPVTEGYSPFIRIHGRRVCLASITGLTDGTPPGMVKYKVKDTGQTFVLQLP